MEYFTAQEADLFTFYRIPKELFSNPKYKGISTDAKLLYGLLLDRNSLSKKNNWIDKHGRIFIYFSREEAMELLDIGTGKVVKLFKELESVDLIRDVRQGLNKPNIIYVGKFVASNTENTIDSPKSQVRTCENRKSGLPEIESQDVQKSKPNKTYTKKTYSNETYHTPEPVCDEFITELQDEIKKITGNNIQSEDLAKLLLVSTPEKIRYHLSNWHIHKQHQRYEGAGWFFTVIKGDIEPNLKNIAQRDNFDQREYTDKEYEGYYANLRSEDDCS